jgi:NAD(P)-dependent dehydrogenase (short-subunit alcohol dehydrogenase family)
MPKPTHSHGRLMGKTAIVTGAGCTDETDIVGTGAAIAAVFAGEGARVCLVDVSPENGERMARRIQRSGGTAIFVRADVTSSVDCIRVVSETTSAFGDVQTLVNNVGGNLDAGATKVGDFSEAKWRQLVDLNLTSAMLMSKAAIPSMIKMPATTIINMASVAAFYATGGVAYSASKAGLIALTRDLALAYGSNGLRANVIAPGHIFTPMAGGAVMEASLRKLRRNIAPLGIEGDAWDVAAAALFLASDEARFITGVCLPVDGGVAHLGPMAALGLVNR